MRHCKSPKMPEKRVTGITVGQKMAQPGDCPNGCCVVALLLEASGTHADVSRCDCAVNSVQDRAVGDCPVVLDDSESCSVRVMRTHIHYPETVRTYT